MIFKAIKKGIKKVFRGVKKVVKKIGSGIKSAVKSVGKFMGKIGIVGQIAMSFILPGIGDALMKGMGGFVSKMSAGASPFISGAGKVLQAAGNFAKAGHSAFKTVTEGIGSFVKEFTGTALKKVPGMENLMPSLKTAPDSFFGGKGTGSAWDRVSQKVMTNGEALVKDFNKAIGYTSPTEAVTTGTSTAAKTVSVKDVTVSAEDMGAGPETFKPEKFTRDDVVIQKPTIGEQSLLSQDDADKGFFEKLYESGKEAVISIPDKIIEAPGKFVEDLSGSIESGLQTKAMQAVGLEDKPEYTTVYEGSVNVPEMSVYAAGSYASPQINDRAYQMSVNPSGFSMSNPWGSPANTYQQELGARYG
jgi:hypothetical protein